MITCIFFDFQEYCQLPQGQSALAYEAKIELNREKLKDLEEFANKNPSFQFCILSENSVDKKKEFLEAIRESFPVLHERLMVQEDAIEKASDQGFLDSVTGGIYSNKRMSGTHPEPWDDYRQDLLKPSHKALAIRHVLRSVDRAFNVAILLSGDETKRKWFTHNKLNQLRLHKSGRTDYDENPGCHAVASLDDVTKTLDKGVASDGDSQSEAVQKQERDDFERDAYARVVGVRDFVGSSRRRVAVPSAERLGKVEQLILQYELNTKDYDWPSLLENMDQGKAVMVFGTFKTPKKKADLVTVLKAMKNSDSTGGKDWLAKQLNRAKHPGAVLQVLAEAWRAHHDQSWGNYFGGRYLSLEAQYNNLNPADKAICADLMGKVQAFQSVAKGRRGWSWRRPKSTIEVFQAIHKRYQNACPIPGAAKITRASDGNGYQRRR